MPTVTKMEESLISGLSRQEIEAFCGVMEKIHAALDADPRAKALSRMDIEPGEG